MLENIHFSHKVTEVILILYVVKKAFDSHKNYVGDPEKESLKHFNSMLFTSL